jgi:hypothetical protein
MEGSRVVTYLLASGHGILGHRFHLLLPPFYDYSSCAILFVLFGPCQRDGNNVLHVIIAL